MFRLSFNWKRFTASSLDCELFNDEHFFIFIEPEKIIKSIQVIYKR